MSVKLNLINELDDVENSTIAVDFTGHWTEDDILKSKKYRIDFRPLYSGIYVFDTFINNLAKLKI
jgi:hypothetical protein